MKNFHKLLIVAIVAIFATSSASAGFRWGIKAGLNFNKLDYKNVGASIQNNDNRTGWEVGLTTEFTVPIVGVGADLSLLYARQNLNVQTIEGHNAYDNKNFIDIPLNLKWKINIPVVASIVKPMIYTGPDFLVALNKNSIKDIKTKTCEVGWNIGIGVELLKHLQIQGGYCIGMNNVMKYTGVDANLQNYKAKKNYWTVTAAYLF